MVHRNTLPGAALAAAAVLAGCGYSTGLGAFRAERADTVAVPAFKNRTVPLRRDIETPLTRAVHDELTSGAAPMTVVAGDADVTLRGEILKVEESSLVEEFRTDVVQSLRVRVTVRVEAVNRDGSRIFNRQFVEAGDTALAGGGTRQDALDRAYRRLAADISRALTADWRGP
ncbi:MAG: LptE family protein [Planctomycetes bacterium]|nr:LptE family protein [Planctomycetota bacterium]